MESSEALSLDQKEPKFVRPIIKSRTTKSTSQIYRQKVKEIYEKNYVKANPYIMSYFKWHFKNPEKAFKIVHVAGTNGKGSVSIKISSLLEKSGFKVGMVISPHISSFRERVQINRQNISESDFCKYYDIINKFQKELKMNYNLFSFSLSMAMLYFKDEKCDYVVLECGVGGFTSKTNHFDSNYAAITSIGFDHTDLLGKFS